MGLISLKITKSKRTETYGYKLQIEFETVCFCTLAPASPKSVTTLIMEVPCCSGLPMIVKKGMELSGVAIPITKVVISARGEIIS